MSLLNNVTSVELHTAHGTIIAFDKFKLQKVDTVNPNKNDAPTCYYLITIPIKEIENA